jgi:formylglycine-generating enzyme required for sulfatase activity
VGLYNVHGNVWDWTQDCWNGINSGNPDDGSARTSGDRAQRVLRGGSWISIPLYLRAADHTANRPYIKNSFFGFRIAPTLTP